LPSSQGFFEDAPLGGEHVDQFARLPVAENHHQLARGVQLRPNAELALVVVSGHAGRDKRLVGELFS